MACPTERAISAAIAAIPQGWERNWAGDLSENENENENENEFLKREGWRRQLGRDGERETVWERGELGQL